MFYEPVEQISLPDPDPINVFDRLENNEILRKAEHYPLSWFI